MPCATAHAATSSGSWVRTRPPPSGRHRRPVGKRPGADLTRTETRRPGGDRRAFPPGGKDQGRDYPHGARGAGGPATRRTGGSMSAPFILRPIATTLMIFAIVLLGLHRLSRCCRSRRCRTSISRPSRSRRPIRAPSPDVVETSITAPLEHYFGQISGLTSMSSTSSYGTSQITLQFDLSRRIDAAAQDVQARSMRASGLDSGRAAARAADLSRGEPGRHAGADPGADLGHAAAARGQRLRRRR